jgi:hypothetical protein
MHGADTNPPESRVTPYQKRLAESKARKSQILKLSRQTSKGKYRYTLDEIAAKVEVSKAYVHQVTGRRPPLGDSL